MNLTNNKKLYRIIITKNEKLENLFLPKSKSVDYIDCSENKLKKLDITKNKGML